MKKNQNLILLATISASILLMLLIILKDYLSIEPPSLSVFFENYIANINNVLLLLIPVFAVVCYFVYCGKYKTTVKQKNREINDQQVKIENVLKYTSQLNKGNFDAECKLTEGDDLIAQILNDIRNDLIQIKEERKQREEENARRKWVTEGKAYISNLFRLNYENIDDLAYDILTNIIKYVGLNQGGVFLIEEDNETQEKYLVLSACFAYDRRKYMQKKIFLGEGLIGACAMEGETIYLTDIPENYVTIGSGLGEARPQFIVLLPIKYNEEIIGVIELASFNELEKYKIEFLEEIVENIASALIGIKNNERTKRLLELANANSHDLKQKEEEIRQNMEEMEATKEEVERKEEELLGLVNAMNKAVYKIEYDVNGIITDVNNGYASIAGLKKEDMLGLSFFDGWQSESQEARKAFWDDIIAGRTKKRNTNFETKNGVVWLSEFYTAVYNDVGEAQKILKLAFDITEMVNNETRLNNEIKKLKERKNQYSSS